MNGKAMAVCKKKKIKISYFIGWVAIDVHIVERKNNIQKSKSVTVLIVVCRHNSTIIFILMLKVCYFFIKINLLSCYIMFYPFRQQLEALKIDFYFVPYGENVVGYMEMLMNFFFKEMTYFIIMQIRYLSTVGNLKISNILSSR